MSSMAFDVLYVNCRVFLHPKQLAYLHHTDIHHLEGIVVQAQGYQKSAPVRVPTLQRSSDSSSGMQRCALLSQTDYLTLLLGILFVSIIVPRRKNQSVR